VVWTDGRDKAAAWCGRTDARRRRRGVDGREERWNGRTRERSDSGGVIINGMQPEIAKTSHRQFTNIQIKYIHYYCVFSFSAIEIVTSQSPVET